MLEPFRRENRVGEGRIRVSLFLLWDTYGSLSFLLRYPQPYLWCDGVREKPTRLVVFRMGVELLKKYIGRGNHPLVYEARLSPTEFILLYFIPQCEDCKISIVQETDWSCNKIILIYSERQDTCMYIDGRKTSRDFFLLCVAFYWHATETTSRLHFNTPAFWLSCQPRPFRRVHLFIS